MPVIYLLADASHTDWFNEVESGVFDNDVVLPSLEALLADERHHIGLAIDDGLIIGFASAVDYVHPDKPRELWINEVGVAPKWQGRGIAKRLLSLMFEHGRKLGCVEAWVLSEPGNVAANALYRSVKSAHDAEPTTALMHSFKLT